MNEIELYKTIRNTLERIPDDVVLAIGSRVFELEKPETCVCGWVIREALARESNSTAEEIDSGDPRLDLESRFGGSYSEWNRIFLGVVDDSSAPIIEEALFDRVMAAAVRSENV